MAWKRCAHSPVVAIISSPIWALEHRDPAAHTPVVAIISSPIWALEHRDPAAHTPVVEAGDAAKQLPLGPQKKLSSRSSPTAFCAWKHRLWTIREHALQWCCPPERSGCAHKSPMAHRTIVFEKLNRTTPWRQRPAVALCIRARHVLASDALVRVDTNDVPPALLCENVRMGLPTL